METALWLLVLVVAACIQLYRLADKGHLDEATGPASTALPPPPPEMVLVAAPLPREEAPRQRSAIDEHCEKERGLVQKKKPRRLTAAELITRAPGQGGLMIAYEILSRPVGMRPYGGPWDGI